jgi:hypothetical protein
MKESVPAPLQPNLVNLHFRFNELLQRRPKLPAEISLLEHTFFLEV